MRQIGCALLRDKGRSPLISAGFPFLRPRAKVAGRWLPALLLLQKLPSAAKFTSHSQSVPYSQGLLITQGGSSCVTQPLPITQWSGTSERAFWCQYPVLPMSPVYLLPTTTTMQDHIAPYIGGCTQLQLYIRKSYIFLKNYFSVQTKSSIFSMAGTYDTTEPHPQPLTRQVFYH